jgi:tetratricopeptide (TPR) repeat protein
MVRFTALLLALAALPAAASAQYIGGRAPAPPPLPAAGTLESPEAALARNVRLLAINPRNYDALLGAGRAALRLGDAQAAIGFYGRAEELNSTHWAPKAGQGAALAQMGEAAAALGMFEQAQRLGATLNLIALDRGLAFDLLGRQAEAQADYRAVPPGPDHSEAQRRLALSLAISGRKLDALAAIDQLIARRDTGARRTRALILALGGDVDGARAAIGALMPGAASGSNLSFAAWPRLRPDKGLLRFTWA